MKKIILTLTLALATVFANAQFLFHISGNKVKEPSYILGSVHTLPGSLLDSIPEFLEAEKKCSQLYAEYDISSQQAMAQVQTAGQQAVSLPDGKTIFDVMNKEQIELLNTRFKEMFQVNITDSLMKAVWNYQPAVLTSSFSLMFTMQAIQKHPEMGITSTPIDLVCINRAKERGMTFKPLDDIQPEDSLKKMRDTLAADCNIRQRPILMRKVAEFSTAHTEYTGQRITADGVICKDKDGREVLVPGKTVICALGQRANRADVDALRSCAPFVREVGDCVRPANITKAIYEAYHAALDI